MGEGVKSETNGCSDFHFWGGVDRAPWRTPTHKKKSSIVRTPENQPRNTPGFNEGDGAVPRAKHVGGGGMPSWLRSEYAGHSKIDDFLHKTCTSVLHQEYQLD